MRIAYFDCFSGLSGDMTLGALIACGVEADYLQQQLALLNLPGWSLEAQPVQVNGIGATDVTIHPTEPPRAHRHLSDIAEILDNSALTDNVRTRSLAIFRRLAEAEARVHQTTPEKVHFHEVGALDAIVDVVGTCIALERLGVEAVYCAPLPMSRGFVRCEHGLMPVPVPAVLELAQNVPVYSVEIEGEIVTPTGAAIVTTLAKQFGSMPTMTLKTAGYGAGKKRFSNRPNLLRVVIGERVGTVFSGAPEIMVLETNLDDFSPQFYEELIERLLTAGALDVFLTPIQMKKGRPATLLRVLAPMETAESLASLLFTETTTLGVRFTPMRRLCLEREWKSVETAYGPIRIKIGRWQGNETTAAPEYEDVKAAARRHNAPLKAVYEAALAVYRTR
jgi:hypothetical protein